MPRYIDTEDFKHLINASSLYDTKEWVKVMELLADTPTADVVEVVRCKDCVHLGLLNSEQYYARCNWHGKLFPSFGKLDTRCWFCADGKRKDPSEVS